jgi:hypothetical protein
LSSDVLGKLRRWIHVMYRRICIQLWQLSGKTAAVLKKEVMAERFPIGGATGTHTLPEGVNETGATGWSITWEAHVRAMLLVLGGIYRACVNVPLPLHSMWPGARLLLYQGPSFSSAMDSVLLVECGSTERNESPKRSLGSTTVTATTRR